jgi:monoamine oxidase
VRGGTTETSLDGETQTARFADGQYMNAGPARIPQHHTTMQYCRELGVELEVFANQNAQAYYYNGQPPSTGATQKTTCGSLQPGAVAHPLKERHAEALARPPSLEHPRQVHQGGASTAARDATGVLSGALRTRAATSGLRWPYATGPN